MEEQEGKLQLHVVMFPWLAFGHILPYLDLSERLADHGVKISFVSTPRNIAKIREMEVTKHIEIDMVELPLPSVEGLPSGAESTADIPNHMQDLLKIALDHAMNPFEQLLERISPDYVIFDFAQYWAATVAAKLHIPSVHFVVFNASFCASSLAIGRGKEKVGVEELTTPPLAYPSSLVVWRPFEARYICGAFSGQPGEISVLDRARKSVQGCSFVAIKSCVEIEGKFIEYLEKTCGKAVVPLGPMGLQLTHSNKGREPSCLSFLDKQPPSSVIYVAFGSEVFLTKEQIGALARGLESTGMPFLWVLRLPRYSLPDDVEEREMAVGMLPEGFMGRTEERGVVHVGWAPQLQILSHASVGVFVCHSGWGSVLEAVKCGVKSVLLPMVNDQAICARLFALELKMGVEVERDDDGNFTADNVREAVLKVSDDVQGKEVGRNVEGLREKLFGDSGCEERYVREFVARLRAPLSNKTIA